MFFRCFLEVPILEHATQTRFDGDSRKLWCSLSASRWLSLCETQALVLAWRLEICLSLCETQALVLA